MENVLGFLVGNWVLIILCIAALAYLIYKVYKFTKAPSDVQIANLKEWLKGAVTEAEAALGSGTGQLKLRYVYDLAIEKFSWLETFVTFEQFSTMVDEALDWMDKQLSDNEAIKTYVINGDITPIELE